MWSTYFVGLPPIRLWASASISSRVPKWRQSAGQALTHAGVRMFSRKLLDSAGVSAVPLRETGAGWLVRSAQCVHFSIFGASLSHSAVGTPHGQARTQYRQPMHLSASYVVGPSGCRSSAVVGQADSHAGSRQWKHRRIVKTHARSFGRAAMTLALDLVGRDERQRLRAQRRRVLEAELPLQLGLLPVLLVPLLAGHLAGAAADALRDVDERRLDGDGGRTAGVLMLSSPSRPRPAPP